jgi:hypothetical protein
MVTTLPESAWPSPQDILLARAGAEKIKNRSESEPISLMIDGESFTLPPVAVAFLLDGLSKIGSGQTVEVVSQPATVTPAEAASILRFSPAYVRKLLDEGTIPMRQVDGSVTIAMGDLLAYKAISDADRRDARQQLMDEAQELGWGY